MQSKNADWWWLSRNSAMSVGVALALSIVIQVFILASVGKGSSTTPLGLIFGPIYGVIAAIVLYAILALLGFLVLPRITSCFSLNRSRARVIIWCVSGISAAVFAAVNVAYGPFF
jgi:hypothetical protein